MVIRLIVIALLVLFTQDMYSQTDTEQTDASAGVVDMEKAFKGDFFNKELNMRLTINLYEENVPVPGLELDNCFGHLRGTINATWVILKIISMEGRTAVVRSVSDRGSDAQNLELTLTDDGIVMKQVDGTNIKGVSGRKYVKLPKTVTFVKE